MQLYKKVSKLTILNFLTNIFYVICIIIIVNKHFDYQIGDVIYSGDLRIHSQHPMESFDGLYNFRLMQDNTPYLSFYPIYQIFEFFSIEKIYFFIIFFIPILAFITMNIVLKQYIGDIYFKNINFNNIFSATLSFIYITNPSYFNRIGHFSINLTYIFLPIFYFLVDNFLKKNGDYRYLFLLAPIIFFGVSSPHTLVGFTGVLFLIIIFNFTKSKKYLIKSLSLILIHIYFISHNFLGMILNKGIILRTSWEGNIDKEVLTNLSHKSNLISSLSGTNFYFDKLLIYPSEIGPGFVIFVCFFLFMLWQNFYKKRSFTTEDKKILSMILLFLVINVGYKSIPFIYENIFFKFEFIKNLLWLVKDPNIFYSYLIFFLIFYFVIKVDQKNKIFFLTSLILVLITSIFQNYYTNVDGYKSFFDSTQIPEGYKEVREYLSKENKRTIWIPNDVYINNKAGNKIPYYPNFNLWLTKNPEVTIANSNYIELINILNAEVISNGCINKEFLSWVLKSNDLYLVLDSNSSSETLNTEKIKLFKNCFKSISTIENRYEYNNITIFSSNMSLFQNNNLVEFYGNTNDLNKYLKENPLSSIYVKDQQRKKNKVNIINNSNIKKVFFPYNDRLYYNNQKLKQSVNYISSVYEISETEDNSGLKYQNNMFLKIYLRVQFILSLVAFLLYFKNKFLNTLDLRFQKSFKTNRN